MRKTKRKYREVGTGNFWYFWGLQHTEILLETFNQIGDQLPLKKTWTPPESGQAPSFELKRNVGAMFVV